MNGDATVRIRGQTRSFSEVFRLPLRKMWVKTRVMTRRVHRHQDTPGIQSSGRVCANLNRSSAHSMECPAMSLLLANTDSFAPIAKVCCPVATYRSGEPSRFEPDRLASFAPGAAGVMRAMLAGINVEARDYQHRIIEAAVRMFGGVQTGRDGQPLPAASSVLIESPTGSGKTVMGLATAALIQRVTGARVGWVAMRPQSVGPSHSRERSIWIRPEAADDQHVRQASAESGLAGGGRGTA